MRSRRMIVNEGADVSIVCDYHSNPPELLSIKVIMVIMVIMRSLSETSDVARCTRTPVLGRWRLRTEVTRWCSL